MKIQVPAEVLADHPRAHHLAVADDQLSICVMAKHKLPHPGDRQRIQNAEQHRGEQREADCDLDSLRNIDNSNQDKPSPVRQMSMSLIPIKGTITPPTP